MNFSFIDLSVVGGSRGIRKTARKDLYLSDGSTFEVVFVRSRNLEFCLSHYLTTLNYCCTLRFLTAKGGSKKKSLFFLLLLLLLLFISLEFFWGNLES
jgi:hypothetical protein